MSGRLSPEPSAHRRRLLQLSRSLECKEINELLYLSEDFIPQTEADSIQTGVDLMRSLERHGRLGPRNYAYLASCLNEIGRIDLVKKLEFPTRDANRHPGHSQISHVLHWKMRAIQDKQQRYLQSKGELQQLSQNSTFWGLWMSETLQKLSTQLEARDADEEPPAMEAENARQALKAAGNLIFGVIQHSGAFIVELESHQHSQPESSAILQLERLEEDLTAVLRSSPMQSAPTTQVEPVVRLKEQHPLSIVASKVFSSLSELLKELCSEAEAQKQLKELTESLLAIKSLLHINAHLCFGFLTLVHLTNMVSASQDKVLDQEAKTIISSLVQGFPEGATLTVVKCTLEALKGTSVLAALKEDENMNILFIGNPPVIPCPCKGNKCLRFGILTVLLTLHKSEKLTKCEWRLIQSRIMHQLRMNLSEPDYQPFLEIDMIVLNSLQRLFTRFPKATGQSFESPSGLEDQLKQFSLSPF